MKVENKILNWVDSKKKIRPTAIVLHWWQIPTWFGGIRWFIFGLRRKQLSVQYVVMKDGKIYQLTESADVWCKHARCANDSSIGIEIQGLGKRDLDKNTEQFEAVTELITYLCKRYKIKTVFSFENMDSNIRFFGVTSHKEVDKYCTNKRWRQKKDVHDEYINRVRLEVAQKIKF